MRPACSRVFPLLFVATACGGTAGLAPTTSEVPPRTRIEIPASEPLMLGIASATDGLQGFSNVFFFNVEPTGARCAPVDIPTGRGAVCTVRDCRTDEPATLPTRLLDVGDVVVRSAAHPPTFLRRNLEGTYALDSETGLRWSAGDDVHVAISGGPDGAAASADLVLPTQPVLVAPEVPEHGENLRVPRGMPLRVRWEAFDGVAFVFLSQFPREGELWLRHIEVECLTDGADGALVIPLEVLGLFVRDGALGANFTLGARVSEDVDLGPRMLRVVAETSRSILVDFE